MKNLENLIIFEMANNHGGQVSHGLKIIETYAGLAQVEKVRAAIKFQLRDLDTFIHPQAQNLPPNRHIARFYQTRLQTRDFAAMAEKARALGLVVVCTAFDEISVARALDIGTDVLKVASCSAQDWPLLAEVRNAAKPVVVSTAGLSLDEVQAVFDFFAGEVPALALMHCVALYPTPLEKLNIGRIAQLKSRFPETLVGFSTHEEPKNLLAVQMAYAAGARIFEKHIGLESGLNAYSSNPAQTQLWLKALSFAQQAHQELDVASRAEERRSLDGLKRGLFAKSAIRRGDKLTADNLYAAIPFQGSPQLLSGAFGNMAIAERDYLAHEPILKSAMVEIWRAQALEKLIEAGIQWKKSMALELSHHQGLKDFEKFGAAIFTESSTELEQKKILVLWPGQTHPRHCHPTRQEQFRVVQGDLWVKVDGEVRQLQAGQSTRILQGQWHEFGSLRGAVVEELSIGIREASVYENPKIDQMETHQRKTSWPAEGEP